MKNAADAGAWYAGRGLAVFPLVSHGKKPATENGLLDASTDPQTVAALFAGKTDANIGIRCGIESGLFALDVDVDAEKRIDGRVTLAALEDTHGTLPPTWRARTPRGGEHIYFRHPGGRIVSRVGIRHGLDVRADGAYTVAPPSVNGKSGWTWQEGFGPHEVELADAPAWVLALVCEGDAPKAAPLPAVIPNGQRNAVLTSLAGSMRRRGAAQAAILAALREENARCETPLPDAELQAIAASVARYPPAEAPRTLSRIEGAAPQREPLPDVLDAVLGQPVTLGAWSQAKRPDWIVEGLLQLGSVTMLSAAGGVGKSLLLTDLLVRLAAGERGDWLGAYRLPGTCVPVAWIEAECGQARIERRIRELVEGEAFSAVVADRAVELLQVWPADVLRQRECVLEVLPALVQRHTPAVVVLDPLRSFLPLAVDDESSNVQLGRVIDGLVHLAKREMVAVVVVDHDSKAGAAARGASSKRDAVEFLLHLTLPDETDPALLQIKTDKARDPGGPRRVGIRRVEGEPTDAGLWPVRFEREDLPGERGMIEKVIDHLRAHGPTAQSDLAAAIGEKATTIRSAVARYRAGVASGVAIVQTGKTPKGSPILALQQSGAAVLPGVATP